uniref:Protein LAZY 1 n=1 Tax=Oryza punctata TaxID=4537 RepID=A0A0E0MFJ7_ORYPU
MKLLGWMHRKLRSNNDVFKEFSTGGGGACNCITGLASPDPDNDYFSGDVAFHAAHASPPVTAGDLFTFGGSGLLTIGTLGIAAVSIPGDDDDDYDVDDIDFDVDASDDGGFTVEDADVVGGGAVTPTFTFPAATAAEASAAVATVEKAVAAVEAIAEKDDDTTTEDDLMVVSAELEKVLGGVDVASARVSFAMGGGVDCPLQGFLFGSPVSDVESRPEYMQTPRDSSGGGRRTSLGELFMRTRFADEKVALVAVAEGEDGVGGGEGAAAGGGERAGKGGGYKSMKKRKVKDEKGGAAGGAMPATVTKSKFQKILQIFHRKVYPENTLLARNLTKKNRNRGATDNGGGAAATGDPDEPLASPVLRCRKDHPMRGFGCCTNGAFGASSPSGNGDMNGNKSGHWIKTDADYLVLEL